MEKLKIGEIYDQQSLENYQAVNTVTYRLNGENFYPKTKNHKQFKIMSIKQGIIYQEIHDVYELQEDVKTKNNTTRLKVFPSIYL